MDTDYLHATQAPQSFGETIGALFSRYPKLFAHLLPIGILLGILLALTESLQAEGLQLLELGEPPPASFFVAVLVGLVGNAYFWTVALLRTDGALAGRDSQGAFARAWGRVLPLIVYLLIYVVVVTVGMLLLVIPGVFLAILLGPGMMLVVLRGTGVLGALRRSATLVWGSWWFSLGVLVIASLIAMIPLLVAESFLANLRGPVDPSELLTLVALSAGGMIFALPLFVSMAYTLIEALEARKHNALMERETIQRSNPR